MCKNQNFDWLIKKAKIWQWHKRQVNVKHDCLKKYVYVKFLRGACFFFEKSYLDTGLGVIKKLKSIVVV